MSARQRAAALRRWRQPQERKRASQHMRVRLRPKLKIGTTPTRLVPSRVSDLLNTLSSEMLEVVECNVLRVNHADVWRIALIDGSDIALSERYYPLVREHGLNLYQIHSRPLATIGGVSIVLFVGLPKGEV